MEGEERSTHVLSLNSFGSEVDEILLSLTSRMMTRQNTAVALNCIVRTCRLEMGLRLGTFCGLEIDPELENDPGLELPWWLDVGFALVTP